MRVSAGQTTTYLKLPKACQTKALSSTACQGKEMYDKKINFSLLYFYRRTVAFTTSDVTSGTSPDHANTLGLITNEAHLTEIFQGGGGFNTLSSPKEKSSASANYSNLPDNALIILNFLILYKIHDLPFLGSFQRPGSNLSPRLNTGSVNTDGGVKPGAKPLVISGGLLLHFG